jgi:hypothetical protein
LFVPDPTEENPFHTGNEVYNELGNSMPADLPDPAPSGGFGKVQGLKGRRFNKRDLYNHAKRALAEMHPGKYWTCDYKEITYTGQMVAKDMLGFMDVCGITTEGKWVACNVTTRDGIKPHLREYTNPKKTHGQAKIPVIVHLREYLAHGGEFYIVGFYKEGRLWKHETVRVTNDLLREYEARKRAA